MTTIAIPGTPYHRMVERGSIEPLTCRELFFEMKEIITKLKPTREIIFRANHVSNQFPLGGILPNDSQQISIILEQWIKSSPEGTYPSIPVSM